MWSRRNFLKSCSSAAAILPVVRSGLTFWPRLPSAGERTLVLLELAGGNDGLNTVIPYHADAYYKARPTLNPGKDRILKVHDEFGLHPGLKGFAELWEEGRLCVVHGVGYPRPDRSHFRSSDIWHTASLSPESVPTGWVGRLSDQRGDLDQRIPGVVLGENEVPRAMLGQRGVVPTVRSVDDFRMHAGAGEGEEERRAALRDLSRGGAAVQARLEFLRASQRAAFSNVEVLESALARHVPQVTYPATDLGNKLALGARLLAGGYPTSVFYLRQGGYDTHSLQAATHGFLLGELGDALHAFCEDLHQAGRLQQVVVLVYSEFGRRVEENGSRGTDHGAAAPAFLAGAKLQSPVIGSQPSLEDLDDGDLRFAVDFRRIYASLLQDWLGVDSRAVLGADFERLALFKA